MRRILQIFGWFLWLPLGLSALALAPRVVEAVDLFLLRDDPVTVLSYRLGSLDRGDYEAGIETALAADDPELARSILTIAGEREVGLDPGLERRIAVAEEFSALRLGRQALTGAATGRAESPVAFGAAILADFTVIGDVRDLAIETARIPDQDNLTIGLAATGIVLTAALAPSGSTSAVAKLGVSTLKAAKKLRRLSLPLERQLVAMARRAVDTEAAGDLLALARRADFAGASRQARRLLRPDVLDEFIETGGALGDLSRRQGYRATLDTLARAETTGEVKALSKASKSWGKRFRGSVYLTRGLKMSLRLGEFLLDFLFLLVAVATWIVTCVVLLARVFSRGLRWMHLRRKKEAD